MSSVRVACPQWMNWTNMRNTFASYFFTGIVKGCPNEHSIDVCFMAWLKISWNIALQRKHKYCIKFNNIKKNICSGIHNQVHYLWNSEPHKVPDAIILTSLSVKFTLYLDRNHRQNIKFCFKNVLLPASRSHDRTDAVYTCSVTSHDKLDVTHFRHVNNELQTLAQRLCATHTCTHFDVLWGFPRADVWRRSVRRWRVRCVRIDVRQFHVCTLISRRRIYNGTIFIRLTSQTKSTVDILKLYKRLSAFFSSNVTF